MRTLTRRVVGAAVLGLLGAVAISAQDAVSEVRPAVQAGREAALKGDAAGYGRNIADDLRWISPDGTIITKQERLDDLVKQPGAPRLGNIDAKVQGDTALVVFDSTFDDGRRQRNARTYIKRDGRWQLVLHVSVPLK